MLRSLLPLLRRLVKPRPCMKTGWLVKVTWRGALRKERTGVAQEFLPCTVVCDTAAEAIEHVKTGMGFCFRSVKQLEFQAFKVAFVDDK